MPLPRNRPEHLPPMKVNTVTMVLTGIGVWVVALVVVLVLRALGVDLADGILRVCGAGIVLGLLALAWAVPQHRGVLRAEAERAEAERVSPERVAADDDGAARPAAASPAAPTSSAADGAAKRPRY